MKLRDVHPGSVGIKQKFYGPTKDTRYFQLLVTRSGYEEFVLTLILSVPLTSKKKLSGPRPDPIRSQLHYDSGRLTPGVKLISPDNGRQNL